MTDVLTPEQRHRCMSHIRSRDTLPELVVRRLVHCMGYRYRLHVKALPGKPDLVFRRLKKAIFVHGCFWHLHVCRYGKVVPRTNAEFWQRKRQSNVERDHRILTALRKEGWKVLLVWECQTKEIDRLAKRVQTFLGR